MKAIETKYKGYRFRSRLEARWAVFFDAIGLTWEYEPEGFDLGSAGWYLPDFKVVSKNNTVSWYEIKPTETHDDGKMAAFENLYSQTEKEESIPTSFAILHGDPINFLGENPHIFMCPRCGLINKKLEYSADYYYCWPCDVTTPSGGDNPPEKCLSDRSYVYPHKGALCFRDPYSLDNWAGHVRLASKKARQARFEHGERGL